LVEKSIYDTALSALLLQGAMSVASFGTGTALAIPLSRAFLAAAVVVGVRVPMGALQLRKLDKYNERYGVK
jgi:hypothetical protein